MALVKAKDLCKSYRVSVKTPGISGALSNFFNRKFQTVQAVRNVSFQINRGEMVGFIGPNGAGKTTTLKMLCGLICPTSGEVIVGGKKPFARDKEFLRQITLVMGQKQQLIWDLPPLDSLYVNAAVYGINRTEAKERIKELSSMLELDEELTRPVRKLSLGQRMKAELLASLLHRPSVLFLDEPTLGLDVNAQARVRKFLADYNKKYGATVLLTSHYMADITSLCSRVMLIHKGSLFHDGSLESLTERLTPYRSVKIAFKEPQEHHLLKKFGELEECDGYLARILIPREKLTNSVSSILNNFPVKDLEIGDPPIEELIGKLFQSGKVQ
ncbi:ATP-binding cassette domain-containing protein [Prochlorococcus sp. MIT 1341]|uniref:ABC transporter ATP-binding protein n=1 Tax=Prochlorococcus sp. MIT 1341 TaxID=3096221 RepID=UPI002A761B10|nr:ATP-binding cassette domain-containing protein [Prochlorococcus sp. MIT 1341]